jgi:hypothetical protein
MTFQQALESGGAFLTSGRDGCSYPSLCAGRGDVTCCSGGRPQTAPRPSSQIAGGGRFVAGPFPSGQSADSCHWTSAREDPRGASLRLPGHHGRQRRAGNPQENTRNLLFFTLEAQGEKKFLTPGTWVTTEHSAFFSPLRSALGGKQPGGWSESHISLT